MNDLQYWKLTLNSLRPLLRKGSINQHVAEHLKNTLHTVVTFLSTLIMETGFDTIQRVTINKKLPNNNNERIHEISLLKYPPFESVSRNGRANYVQQSVLYATFNSLTALSEMKPAIGDLITISTWELPKDVNLIVAPIFMITSGNNNESHNGLSLDFYANYERTLQQHPKEIQDLIHELLIFVSECFAKEVEDGNHHDYMLSAWFANQYFNVYERGIIEAIVYPSVKYRSIFQNNYWCIA